MPGDFDRELIAGCHHRAGRDSEGTHRQVGPVMRRKDGLHGKAIKQAVLDHRERAPAGFLARLKDQVDRPINNARPGQVLGGGQQHRCVAIMSARMHPACDLASVRQVARFIDWQGIHVGPKTECAVRRTLLDDPDQSGFTDILDDLDSTRGELPANDVSG